METKGKNMKPKTDLDKLNEQDWEKYEKMRKVASRKKITGRFLATLIFAVVIGSAIGIGLITAFVSMAGNTASLANYASNQTFAVLHNLNISFNGTDYLHWTNATLSTLITAMKNNPKALSTFAVSAYANMQSYFFLFMFLFIVIFVVSYYLLFFSGSSELSISQDYKYFKRKLNRLTERDENLKAYGYTEQEIAWYHAIRSELIKLELEYQM
jgi:predicted PurR-regulated permease PerM